MRIVSDFRTGCAPTPMAIKYLKPSRTPEAGEDDVRQAVARMLREIEVGRGAKVLEYARQLGACRSNRDDSEKWDGQPTNGPIWPRKKRRTARTGAEVGEVTAPIVAFRISPTRS